jgi:hypothetical protein
MQLGWDMWMPVYSSLHVWLKGHNFQLSENPCDTPFTAVYKDGLFEFLGKNAGHAKVFNESMEHLAYPSAHLFPFAGRVAEVAAARGGERPRLVDVGGGKGQAAREILETYSQMKCEIILQDQPAVLEEVPADLRARGIKLMPYDFFKPQPIKGMCESFLIAGSSPSFRI